MKVKSTGLGKTQLTAHFDGFTAKEGGEPSAVLIITSTEPVHWHIECDLGGSDLRQFAGQVLRPSMIWHLIKLLARGGEARGFVMEKEGGRRSRKERVSRTAEAQPSAAATAATTSAATESPIADTAAVISAQTPSDTPVATTSAPTKKTGRQAPAPRPAPESASTDSADREEREHRRAERRRQREEAAQQYVTVG